jgi:CRP/FNR family transcriptional regulator, cyclic AMP receptor protein
MMAGTGATEGADMTSTPAPALAGHQFTHGMPADYVAALSGAARHIKVPARYRLFDEGGTADRFWLIQAGQVALDMHVPGRGLVVIEALGMGDVIGWSWLFPPYQWRLGAVAMRPTQAFEVDGPAVREMCAADAGFGYELTRRFLAVVVNRLQATRSRLIDLSAHSPDWP